MPTLTAALPSCPWRAPALRAAGALAFLAGTAHAQWAFDGAAYHIERVGFFDDDHTGFFGEQSSRAGGLIPSAGNALYGWSTRYDSQSRNNGNDMWVWRNGVTERIGLEGADYTGSKGRRLSGVLYEPFTTNPARDIVVGLSVRYTGIDTNNGQDAWVWRDGVTQQIGLFGSNETWANGYRFSDARFTDADNRVYGFSLRAAGGQSAWMWDGTSTRQFGFTDALHTRTDGYQYSTIVRSNAAGQFTGYTNRFLASAPIGAETESDAWIWDGQQQHAVGLTGGVYTTPDGHQSSGVNFFNDAGFASGTSRRYTEAGALAGNGTWAWHEGVTVEVGLQGTAYVSTTGAMESRALFQNAAGQLGGRTSIYAGTSSVQGTDAWVWTGSQTVSVGLSGPSYQSPSGARINEITVMNQQGQAAGVTQRYTPQGTAFGGDAWVWNGSATIEAGLHDPIHTSPTGRRTNQVGTEGADGQFVGTTGRFSATDTGLGTDAWVWRNGTTTQVGLTGGLYTSASGTQFSSVVQTRNGLVGGNSLSYNALGVEVGSDAWVWNGMETVAIGLTGPLNTSPSGHHSNQLVAWNETGRLYGYATRYSGQTPTSGHDAWVWDGARTIQVGLTGDAYRFSDAQGTQVQAWTPEGIMIGTTTRQAAGNVIGMEAWYFDPLSELTYCATAGVVAAYREDGLTSSNAISVTPDGVMLGTYLRYGDGAWEGVQRAFAFRPDLGFADLGDLLAGGLTASNWLTLDFASFAPDMWLFAGTGRFETQASGGDSVFVITPTPSSAALLALATVLATRRRIRID